MTGGGEEHAGLAAAAADEASGALRDAWEAVRRRLAPSPGPDAEDPGACLARTRATDALVRAVAAPLAAEGVCVLATGGYGRCELAPGSDVDLLLARRPGFAEEGRVEAVLRRLWDAGVEVGHAVRDLDGVRRSLERDLSAATATLEGRFVAGDPATFEAVREVVHDFLARDRERFVDAKLAEADERHAAAGDTVCLLAPDLKSGRGTLRDLQLVDLLAALHGADPFDEANADDGCGARVLPGLLRARRAGEAWLDLQPEEAAGLERALRLLLACRAAVHEAAPAPTDRLEPVLQLALAQRFGYAERDGRLPVEVFMDEVYRGARLVDRIATRCRLTLEPPTDRTAVFRARPLAAGVVAQGDEVALATAGDGAPAPGVLAELFRQAFRTRRRVGPRTVDAVRRGLLRLDRARLRSDREVVAGLREVLAGVRGVAGVLRAMHDAGYLGAVLPEFGDLECLAQADPYHEYTVDEHTLAVLAGLEGVDRAGRPAPVFGDREALLREELLHRTGRRDLLRLGVLLHDAGKVGGSLGHTERGVALVPAVAARLGLEPAEERHVRFLVREHLTLSRLAEKRDVDDPATVEELLRAVGNDRERLDHLYLLTCADVQGVSPRAMTRWKDYLMTRLYELAGEAIEGGRLPAGVARPDSVEAWLRLLAGRVADPAALREHLERCSRRYLIDAEPEEVLLHLELLDAFRRAGGEGIVRCSVDEGCERVWVMTWDRPGLLADLCGAITGSGYRILAMSTFERDDGLVFDRFAVAGREEEEPAGRWTELEGTIRRVLRREVRAESLIAARIRREGDGLAAAPPPVRVRISNDVSPDATMIDVSAPDRVGLLFDLTRTLAAAGCDIRLAKVTTKGDRAVDVFHVTGPEGGQVGAVARARLREELDRAARAEE